MSRDNRNLVSSADLVYRVPVANAYDGQPIGNGRMGTLVWTTPGTVHFQINRGDVFAVGRNHQGHQAWPLGPKDGHIDYCGGCGKVSVDLGGDAFKAAEHFEQRLSLHDAEISIRGEGVTVRCFISAVSDVLVMEIDDRRSQPLPVNLSISMWREPEVKTGDHIARWEKTERNGVTILAQQFEEKEHYCASALAGKVSATSKGKTTVLISSTAGWSRTEKPQLSAGQILDETARHSYEELRQEHVKWWTEFWSRTFVQITGPDERGRLLQRIRHLHLYYMASTSRGKLPAKWNGSMFITDGDKRYWGSQYWVWTVETLYFPLLAADAIDLMEPYFNMYAQQLPECKKAARQRWGAVGAFYPETTPFAGPVILPEENGREFQDVYLGRKPLNELSKATHDLCQFDSSLRTMAEPEAKGPVGRFSWISHLVSSGSELAIQFWWRYRYTGDVEWLRDKGYPILRETAEFFRSLAKKGNDGKYHIHGTNVHEMFWGVNDGIMDLAAIRGTFPLAIRAAEILNIDADLRAGWRGFLDNLAPYPMGSEPESKALVDSALADDVWSAGHLGEVNARKHLEDCWLAPVFPFEDWTLETKNPEIDRMIYKIIDLAPRLKTILAGEPSNTADRIPIIIARAGLGEKLPVVLEKFWSTFDHLANFMSSFEGGVPENQAQSVEHLGVMTTALQDGLLQSLSPRPGEPEIIRVFPACPKEWEVSFRLLARGGFLVSSAIKEGKIEYVEIESRLGGACRLSNPWTGPCLIKDGEGEPKKLPGNILCLCFETLPGRKYRVTPAGGGQ
jgi:hypothetical protein